MELTGIPIGYTHNGEDLDLAQPIVKVILTNCFYIKYSTIGYTHNGEDLDLAQPIVKVILT